MRIALIHDYLNQWGGGERVLKSLSDIFPEADIYTLLYDGKKFDTSFPGRKIHTSLLDLPFVRNNHRFFIPLMPLAAQLLKISKDYDVVISSSASFAKGVKLAPNQLHICYCHTPMRYAWEPEYISSKFGDLKFIDYLIWPILKYLRVWDYKAAQNTNLLIANSQFIADKIKKYYEIDAPVLYPPISTNFFTYDKKVRRKDYYLVVGRMMHYKRFDLVIKAFNDTKIPLKIVGSGPEMKNLREMKRSLLIQLCGQVSDEELKKMYREAQALIFPQVEDFGMVAAETLACGTPVIAFNKGGACEIVEHGKNGLLFNEQTPDSLLKAVQEHSKTKWDHEAISKSAEKFSSTIFKERILVAVDAVSKNGL